MTAIADLPGPRRLPGLGNALRLRPDRVHVMIEQWGRRYGPVFRFDIGPRAVVSFTEPDTINAILRERPDGYRRWREVEDVFAELGVNGVFAAEGEDWRRQRRLAVTALNTDHLHRYFAVVETATGRLYGRLSAAARTGAPHDIHRDFQAFTVDVTSALAFGHDLNTLERGDDALNADITRVFEMLSRRILAPFPYWRTVKLPADREGERSQARVREAIEGFIAQARAKLGERPENFLQAMLAAEERFSDADVVSNVFTMLLAGEDTTSHTLGWTAFLLTQDPATQRRLAGEARTLLDGDRWPRDADTASAFAYGEAVLREAMRLKSTAPVIFLETLQESRAGGVELPVGTRVAVLTRQAGVGDDRRFDPERPRDRKAFLAFGAGPRFCPGRNLAFLEAKAALAMVARNFELTLAGGPVRERYGFTMGPAGLRVRLRQRGDDG
jgi:cytochrome P450